MPPAAGPVQSCAPFFSFASFTSDSHEFTGAFSAAIRHSGSFMSIAIHSKPQTYSSTFFFDVRTFAMFDVVAAKTV